MSILQKSPLEDELKFYETSIKALSVLLIIYFVINIVMSTFYDTVLVLEHSNLVSGILGGFIGIALFIQIRRYMLYRRIGKGNDFLQNRSFILLLVVILVIIYTLFF